MDRALLNGNYSFINIRFSSEHHTMSNNNNNKKPQKPKKHKKQIELENFAKESGNVHAGLESVDIMENTTRKTIHHDFTIVDPIHKNCDMVTLLPQLMSGHIACRKDDKSPKLSWYTALEIYGNWPLGKKRGEDPIGDQLMDFFNLLHERYIEELASKDFDTLRKKICMLRGLPNSTPAKDLVKHPVRRDVFRDGDNMGEIDPSKSPNVSLIPWYMDADPDNLNPDDFNVNNGLQKILCSIIDKRTDFYNEKAVKDEKFFNDEFVYIAKDYMSGKYPFRLRSSMELITPKVYFDTKGPGNFQFKISKMRIYRKYASSGQRGLTEEQQMKMIKETEAADRHFGHKRLLDAISNDNGTNNSGGDGQEIQEDHGAGDSDNDSGPQKKKSKPNNDD